MMRQSRRQFLSGGAAALLVASCGTANAERPIQAAPTTPPPTPAPTSTTTTIPPTTTTTTTLAPTTTTTTLAPTTQAPTTVVVALPTEATIGTPVAPPAPRAKEPVVELGTIEIPAIGVSKTMYEGISLNTLDRGPGHWPGTAMPSAPGNVVVAGHRTSHDRPFYDLDKLQPGDAVVFSSSGLRHVYKVIETLIVTPDALWITDQGAGRTATLFACHPKGSTRQRIVVRADYVESQAA